MQSKTIPWTHQQEAYDFALQKQGVMLAFEMGCGKSKVAIDLAVNRGQERILVACPLSVLGVWPREFRTHAARPYEVCVLNKGTVRDKTEQAQQFIGVCELKDQPFVVVINHESLWRDPFGLWAMDKANFDLVIIDESHRTKSYKGRLGKYVMNLGKALAQRNAGRLCLTGTPAPHSPLDIFAQFRFLDASIFGYSFFRFRGQYALMGGFQNKVVVGYKDGDRLNRRFRSLAVTVKKKDCLDLPEELHVRRTCQLSPMARRAYDELESDFYAELEKGEVTVLNALTKLLRLQQITSGYLPVETVEGQIGKTPIQELGRHKVNLLKDVLEDLTEPVIVFCRFRWDLEQVRKVTAELGRRYGELSGSQRDLTDDAEMPPDIDVMGVQIQSGGVGVDFTRSAVAIYFSLGFSLADYLQSQARLHRPGQTRPVTYIHLLVENTMDEKVGYVLEHREQVIESILGEKKAAA